ncbi:GTP 3',8-cyclase MoaA [Lachnospiraceae bacterium BSM-380-WT-5A]|uniref:GTP 3',8-cyclase n=1 Tax=Oliverpabstia intestinalis TaxID=2606633 RepID=A0A7X2P3N8_9FIRM|nr:GTP 3',8-cyclase MoaA [Oliverpabstia intestinalis]MST66915.1 GTP 3',8-cyclase MoaA [Oliverpabstia intestinalis]
MLDRYGRVINYLRISVTDRCNLRCCYCMPEGVQDVGMKNILTFEEIWEIVRTGVSLGITHIRITGGEPLVRKGCVDLIRGIREIPGVETITMTTNGVLLGNYGKQLKEAGVDGVNISLDTLDPEEFYKITGKRELQEVLAGIRAAKTAGLPVKLNAVNRKELDPIPLVRYAQEENLPLRFIEIMPVGYGKKYVGRSNEELRETLEAVCGKAECMTNREELSRMGSGPAVYYQFSDLKVPVGFISAIHGKFCDTCNRVRLTAEGYLKLCLCYDEGEDLRRVLREGEKENLRTIMEQTIFRKPAAHCFEHPAEMTETHEMVKIGG